MAINRYDTPAQAQFINTYSPIPFDEMMKIGLMKQARVDEGQKRADEATAALSAFKVAAPDEPEYLRKQGEYLKKLDTLYNETGNTGSVEFMRGVNKLKAEMATDTDLRSMSQNYTTYNKMVADVNEAAAKFGENSPAVYKARKQLQEFNTGSTNEKGESIKGTKYLQSKTGMGILQPQGIGTPAEAQPVLDKYLEPVKADAVGSEGLDASGMFKVGTKSSGITYNKLGAVLGISFKEEVKGGRRVASIDENAPVRIPADFYNTQAGMYMAQSAEQYADSSNGKITKEQAFEALYRDAAVRSISSHVSSSSEQSLDINPFSLAAYNKKLETEIPEFSSNVILASESSKFNSKSAVDDGLANFDIQIEKANEEKNAFIEREGLTERILPINGSNNVMYIGKDGKDYTQEVREKQLEIEEYQGQKDNLDKMYKETLKDARVPATYQGPTKEMREESIVAGSKARALYLESLAAPANEEQLAKADEIERERAKDYLTKKDPYYKTINAKLEENAAKLSFNAKVTRFGDKNLNTAAETYFKTAVQNSAVFDTAGNELNPSEKAKFSKLSFVTTENGQGDNVHFEGAVWNKEKHMYQFAYSINSSDVSSSSGKKGIKKANAKTILVEAPDQAVDILIEKGLTTQAQQVIQQQMSMMSDDPNKESPVYFGDKNKDPNAGLARQVRESEKYQYKAGTQYIIEVPLAGPDGVKRTTAVPFDNITEAGAWYENYRATVAKLAGEQKK